ncbi:MULTISPECIES: hypothetical protein [Halomicrobium]|uniref:Lipoprotein n=1 Tax=Halomicrobium mukohataei TaxID=57705 RepID=A0A4D6KPG3_9EURY|nr:MULTISPECIES: hypothetical protein [Halomicrobium]QCD66776.1 hypothetical protein E5139_14410 [Halomicrobium mukohataei]QFR21585.1 hypothetical protein GBQ70_14425 [Halomicrobium sp. ZPS1]
MDRRKFVAQICTGSVLISGCISTNNTPSMRDNTPIKDTDRGTNADNNGTPNCSEVDRFERVDNVVYSEHNGLQIQSNRDSVSLGDDIAISLVNISNSEKGTGHNGKYTIEKKIGSEWHPIYESKEQILWTSVEKIHKPGSGFTWEFNLSREGMKHSMDGLTLCQNIIKGTYRFIYFGINEERRVQAIAEEFTVE